MIDTQYEIIRQYATEILKCLTSQLTTKKLTHVNITRKLARHIKLNIHHQITMIQWASN